MPNQDNGRCPALRFNERTGEHAQCEGQTGHTSAHYSGEEWWPNVNGFPYWRRVPSGNLVGLILLLALIGLTILFAWVVVHHRGAP